MPGPVPPSMMEGKAVISPFTPLLGSGEGSLDTATQGSVCIPGVCVHGEMIPELCLGKFQSKRLARGVKMAELAVTCISPNVGPSALPGSILIVDPKKRTRAATGLREFPQRSGDIHTTGRTAAYFQ